MENFSYYNPTQIEFGKDKEKDIATHLNRYNIKKVLIVFGSDRVKRDGLFDTVVSNLKKNSIEYLEFGGIVSNPLLSRVKKAIEISKESSVDAILAVGGGSVLDSAKAIATGTLYDGDVWDFFIGKSAVEKALPIFSIMTLSATGSEMNPFAVVTKEETKEKYSIISPLIYPKVSIINPKLQQSVSKEYLVYSASDIIAHSIEGYFTASTHPKIISRQIEAVIKTVIETTEVLIDNPEDYNARSEFAWASTTALNGTTYLGVADFSYPNHMIEHALSALYNVPHGAGLSVIVPAWMKWFSSKNEAQFTRFSREIFGKDTVSEGIQALENWFNKIGTPTKLSQLNLYQENIDEIIEIGLKNASYFGIGDMYREEVLREILENAL